MLKLKCVLLHIIVLAIGLLPTEFFIGIWLLYAPNTFTEKISFVALPGTPLFILQIVVGVYALFALFNIFDWYADAKKGVHQPLSMKFFLRH